MQQEFEIKARIGGDNRDRIESFVQNLSVDPKNFTQEDVYFDTSENDLFKKGAFIRVRDNTYCDIKYNADINDLKHVVCDEHRFDVPLGEKSVNEIRIFLEKVIDGYVPNKKIESELDAVGLVPFVSITKNRTVYLTQTVEIVIDDIEGLGSFIEIEARDDSNASAVMNLQKELDLEHIPIGYVELYLREYNFDLYEKGKYVLEKDATKNGS